MVRKNLISGFVLVSLIGVCFFISGCNGRAEQIEKDNTGNEKLNVTTEAVPNITINQLPTQETKNEPLEISESNKDSIDVMLNKREDVYEIKWSSDNSFVAFVKGDTEILEGQLFLWKVGEKKPTIIEGLNERICEIIWSPNNNYVFVDIGTSALRAGYIVEAKEYTVRQNIVYTGNAQWSPDSLWIAVGMESTIQPVTPTELNGVRDLVIFNIETGEKKIIAKATSEYDYVPRKWDQNGTLHYEKYCYTDINKSEKLTYIYKQ